MKLMFSSSAAQRGITLLESLIAVVIAAAGLLGIVGMQLRTLSDTQNSVRRTQAIRLIDDLSERMTVNPNALDNIDDYVIGWGTAVGSPRRTPRATKLCHSSNCTAAELAKYDIREWKRLVESSLPGGDVNVFLAPGETVGANRRQLGVMIRWRENERHIADASDSAQYKEEIDLTKQIDVNSAGARTVTNLSGSAVQCNSSASGPQYTCHLQYLPVRARCATYLGTGGPQYYCPGS